MVLGFDRVGIVRRWENLVLIHNTFFNCFTEFHNVLKAKILQKLLDKNRTRYKLKLGTLSFYIQMHFLAGLPKTAMIRAFINLAVVIDVLSYTQTVIQTNVHYNNYTFKLNVFVCH